MAHSNELSMLNVLIGWLINSQNAACIAALKWFQNSNLWHVWQSSRHRPISKIGSTHQTKSLLKRCYIGHDKLITVWKNSHWSNFVCCLFTAQTSSIKSSTWSLHLLHQSILAPTFLEFNVHDKVYYSALPKKWVPVGEFWRCFYMKFTGDVKPSVPGHWLY